MLEKLILLVLLIVVLYEPLNAQAASIPVTSVESDCPIDLSEQITQAKIRQTTIVFFIN